MLSVSERDVAVDVRTRSRSLVLSASECATMRAWTAYTETA